VLAIIGSLLPFTSFGISFFVLTFGLSFTISSLGILKVGDIDSVTGPSSTALSSTLDLIA